jgi:hypothetical protein
MRSMMNAYCPKVFPRPEWHKVERMTKYVEWKRRQIRERHMQVAGLTLAWLVGIPLGLALITGVWRLALNLVLS